MLNFPTLMTHLNGFPSARDPLLASLEISGISLIRLDCHSLCEDQRVRTHAIAGVRESDRQPFGAPERSRAVAQGVPDGTGSVRAQSQQPHVIDADIAVQPPRPHHCRAPRPHPRRRPPLRRSHRHPPQPWLRPRAHRRGRGNRPSRLPPLPKTSCAFPRTHSSRPAWPTTRSRAGS